VSTIRQPNAPEWMSKREGLIVEMDDDSLS
jgi:hypothetical protein